jgi:ssDNA-binding Zn-finger/Zn-ribbon topoisomerase 1
VVGTFCRAYPVREAIEKFLGAVYAPSAMEGRYDYIPADSSAGVIIYDDKFAYSHHATDPASGLLLNAFDLVRIHKFGSLDDKASTTTTPGKMPSFVAMCEFAIKDEKVKAEFTKERQAQAEEEFSDEDWQTALELDKQGRIKDTLDNIVLIIRHDKELQHIAFNCHRDGIDAKGGLPWEQIKAGWNDSDNALLKVYLSSKYGVYSPTKTKDAVLAVAAERAYHPVKEYLDSLPKWDGISRVDNLLIDYFGATDNSYTKAVIRKTMVAQQLYEGVKVKGEGNVGLVTYIRTDSLRLSDEAVENAKQFILSNYGEKYHKFRVYKKAKKNESKVQDAHEAIRPTSLLRTPEKIKDSLTTDQYKLYSLIWKRALACQMADAEYDVTKVLFNNNDNIFESNGKVLVFDGFRAVYGYADEKDEKMFPEVKIDEVLEISKVIPEQHFTQPPARYTEASLIKDLEEKGIGRPSTYAPTITTITSRDYVAKEKGYLFPTDMGFLVTEMMEKYFPKIVNEKFTADLENHLDDVASGNINWRNVISNFYESFKKELDVAENEMKEIEIKDEVSDVKCDNCGAFMVIKSGRFGKFLACPNYPECKNTKPLNGKEPPEEVNETCEKCGSKMLKRKGKFGEFLACSNYPKCKNTKPIIKTIDAPCPRCGKQIAIKFSKAGRRFYGCTGYPDCKYISWYEPTDKKCPECGEMMVLKNNKQTCINKKCKKSE